MNKYNSKALQGEDVISNLKEQIMNFEFYDKEQLFNYMLNLRTNGISQLDSKTIRELLNLFDSINNEQSKQKTPNQLKRTRKKPSSQIMGNAAFTKVGLLVINIITFTLLIAMIVLLNK